MCLIMWVMNYHIFIRNYSRLLANVVIQYSFTLQELCKEHMEIFLQVHLNGNRLIGRMDIMQLT